MGALKAEAEKARHAVTAPSRDKKEAKDAETIQSLRKTIRVMANHIQALSLALGKKDELIAALRSDCGDEKIVVLPTKPRTAEP